MEGYRRNTCPLQILKYLCWLYQRRKRQMLCIPFKLAKEIKWDREALEYKQRCFLGFDPTHSTT